LIYIAAKGALYYDDDATGADRAVLIASFSNHPVLAVSDFVLI
jgi:hypothetical protein